MKQSDLAAIVPTSRQSVGKWENGDIDLSTETIRRLCEIFHVTADYLLGLSSAPTPELTDADADLVAAYHAAPQEIRNIVDTALNPYQKKKITAAG